MVTLATILGALFVISVALEFEFAPLGFLAATFGVLYFG